MPSDDSPSASGRIAVITGASSNIGVECMRRLARAGHSLLAVTRNERNLVGRLREAGVSTAVVRIVEADLTNFPEADPILDDAIDQLETVDVLVNGVGGFTSGPVLDTEPGQLLAAVSTNLLAPYVAIRAVLPSMIRQRGGAIINVGSAFGIVASTDVRCAAYGAAKAAVAHLTRLLAIEVGHYRIRVNCVCPGVLNPVASGTVTDDFERLHALRQFLDRQALGRFATASEVASLIAFLTSDEAASITGAVLPVDCGMTTL